MLRRFPFLTHQRRLCLCFLGAPENLPAVSMTNIKSTVRLMLPHDNGVICLTGCVQVNDSYGQHLETYTERVKDAVIKEPFIYTDCFDDSLNFTPPSSYVTTVHVELVRTATAAAAVDVDDKAE